MIKNYSTEVAEEKTVGEITGLLAAKGVRSIQIVYDDRARPEGISFVVLIEHIPIPFKLPCNFEGVKKAMSASYKDRGARYRFERNCEEQVRRVAWRIIKDWIASQMALIEAEQASLPQVFLPYCVMNQREGLTVFDKFMSDVFQQKQLPEAVNQ